MGPEGMKELKEKLNEKLNELAELMGAKKPKNDSITLTIVHVDIPASVVSAVTSATVSAIMEYDCADEDEDEDEDGPDCETWRCMTSRS